MVKGLGSSEGVIKVWGQQREGSRGEVIRGSGQGGGVIRGSGQRGGVIMKSET